MNLDTLSNAELFTEISELAREQGVTSVSEWNELCDEVLESHQDMAELNADQDLEGKRQELHMMWEQYSELSGEESAGAIAEDPEAPNA